MAERDRFSEHGELEEALRRHYRDELTRVPLRPLTAAEVTGATPLRSGRRPGWVSAVAASLVLVAGGAGILWQQQANRPVTAIPTPVVSQSSTLPTTGLTGTVWNPRVTAPIEVSRYAQASVDASVYLFAGVQDDGTCALDGFRYAIGPDTWLRLADGPSRASSSCADSRAFVSGSRVYLAIQPGDGPSPALELYSYDTTSDAWQGLPALDAPEVTACAPVGLESGIFCLDDPAAATSSPAGYHWFDYASGTWSGGELLVATGQPRLSVSAHAFWLGGREHVLLDTRLPGGGIALAAWDPSTGDLGNQSAYAGTGVTLGPLQVTTSGVVVLPPPADPSAQGIGDLDQRATTAVAVNVASHEWWTADVPAASSPLTREFPSDAAWAVVHYPSETAGLALVNGYLYQPDQRSWLAVTPLGNPDQDRDNAATTWVGDAMLCRTAQPLNCWGLTAGNLGTVTTGIDQASVTASNLQPR